MTYSLSCVDFALSDGASVCILMRVVGVSSLQMCVNSRHQSYYWSNYGTRYLPACDEACTKSPVVAVD